ncbi:MAG TPA: efflux RND transporter periplasmic adaptor subunit [Polyangiaceae bacterium]|nr:efflux RND transporter periplasmic adaptor subunit [Polyangiaceae bacterium]
MQAKGPDPSHVRSALPPWQQARGAGPRADALPTRTPPSGAPAARTPPSGAPAARTPHAGTPAPPTPSGPHAPDSVVAAPRSQANDVERTQIYVHPAALKPPSPAPAPGYGPAPQAVAPGPSPHASPLGYGTATAPAPGDGPPQAPGYAPAPHPFAQAPAPFVSGPPTGPSPFAGPPPFAPPPSAAPAPARSPLRGGLLFFGGIVVLSALAVIGALPKLRRGEAQAAARAEATAPRRVLARRVAPGPRQVTLTLPATASALRSTAVHAKTTGYVRQVGADIGERVKAGQLLARLEVPETEQERQVAQARLEEANSNARLVQAITEKQTRLAESGAVSAVEGDEARLRQTSARASVRATKAELRRLDALNAYQRVTAPFDGVVTKRLVDPGALVGAGGGALFEVSDVSTLRVFVDVPQSLAAAVAGGLEAEVVLPRSQAEPVRGTIVRSAGALDPTLRTLRTEIHIPGGGAVLAGSFVNVRLKLPNDRALPALPASALIVRKEGTLVATLSDDDRVHLVPVKLGRDLGKEIELLAGAAEGQRVVANPPDDLAEGEKVRAVEPPPAEAPAGKP